MATAQCEECYGSGRLIGMEPGVYSPYATMLVCEVCGGTGRVPAPAQTNKDALITTMKQALLDTWMDYSVGLGKIGMRGRTTTPNTKPVMYLVKELLVELGLIYKNGSRTPEGIALCKTE